MAVLIFANGDLEGDGAWIRPFLAQATVTIAADGGLSHLQALDHPPQMLIGDLDSVTPAQLAWAEAHGCETIRHPQVKDETDLELALLYAIDHYRDEVLVFAAFGGRVDQALSNILLLAHPDLFGRRVALMAPHQRTWIVTAEAGAITVDGREDDLISLIPLGGDVRVAETAGLQWPLHFGPARGVSNRMTAERASIRVAEGLLLCTHTDGAWQR